MNELLYSKEDRQTGRTTRMWDLVVDQVLDGQPYCYVIMSNYRHVRDAFDYIQLKLISKGVPTRLHGIDYIEADGSIIRFFARDTYEEKSIGLPHPDYCEFWDHWCLGK